MAYLSKKHSGLLLNLYVSITDKALLSFQFSEKFHTSYEFTNQFFTTTPNYVIFC